MGDFDFDMLITGANGMLPASVYAEISKTAAEVNADILEVGTAHGASAIAAAIGLKSKYSVKTIDKLQGGSRAVYGTIQENESIIRANIQKFGVAERVELFIGSSEDVADKIRFKQGIGMLILDADGAIDRDFRLYYNQLLPGAPIIIDDYRPNFISIMRSFGGDCHIGQKHRLTALLVDYFESKGLLTRNKVLNDTYFGSKPLDVTSDVSFDVEDILRLYRSLTFVKGSSKSKLISKGLANLKRKAPAIHLTLKKIFRPGRT